MDFFDAIHPRQGENNAAMGGDAAPHVTKTSPARRDWDAMKEGEAQDFGDTLRASRQAHGIGELAGKPFVASVLATGCQVKEKLAGG
jgi:hypothetical protein